MGFATGQRLGHYEILAPLGAGGMGEVYRAHDTLLRRMVAIKILHANVGGEARGLLLREARAASALSHPHICAIHSVEEAEGISFIVMEHLSGQSLQELTKRALPVDQVRRYGIQVARALANAHEHRVIHRDLKSANIIITEQGDAKVLDFGIAQAVDTERAGDNSTYADPGTSAGTIAYMAPERLNGAPADARSDIWSLGIVLYEMATGSLPFKGATLFTLSAAILDRPVGPPISALPATLARVIERCLEKDPARRYQAAGEVAASLEIADPIEKGTERRWSWKSAGVAAAVIVAAVAAYVAMNGGGTVPPDNAPGHIKSVAILPLQVIGAGSDEAHLGVGIADAIITRLAGVRQLALRPTTAVLPYANQSPDPAQVGAALNVEHVIVGTIQPTATTYRVSLQLVRAADRSVDWVQTVDVSRSDLLALQDTVAEQIVSALRLELTGSEREKLKHHYTDNTDAYTLYVKGRVLLLNYTEANTLQAIESFNQALNVDPNYTLARAGLATASAWFSVRYAYGKGAIEWSERAEREARAALAADPSLGEAHLAIASAAGTLYRGFDWITVLEESDRALSLDPGLELAYLARMRALYHLGEFERAIEEGRLARAVNPSFNAEIARLDVVIELLSGDYAAARDLATALLARTDAPAVQWYLGVSLYYLGETGKAREILAGVRQGGQPDVRSQASLASIEAATGAKETARERALAIERGSYMDHHVAYSLGATWAQLGEPTTSLRWLQQAVDTGFPCRPWLARDSLLDPLRGNPAFAQLLAGLEERKR